MPPALEQLTAHAAPLAPEDAADLRRFLAVVPDPRDARGRRYPAPALLCGAAAAVLAGARSLIAVGEWISDVPRHALGVLGFTADPFTGQRAVPHPATVRRLLERVDGDALDAAIGAYLQARHPLSQLDALAEAGCDPVFSEKISTRIKVRPEFVKAMDFARTIKKAVPHQRVIFTVHEMKRLVY
ncbi:hypothetical protein HEK616_83970 (plasmid) [Streptomyces nigrescens]|uniref:H repeat-associated protein N-terminal domain-containing protein n=1 Tax=Streptomyces nigrescens TaxID=1920 RepID=A0ABM8A833_STRNI|nr:hypothetical protein HEK616_83970 [Streptomyces nigrescens]